MDLKNYFEENRGFGVLASADGQGYVDAAVYSRPHVQDDGSVAFIMRDRLTHANIQTNPQATYLFREDKPGYRGLRLFMTKVSESEEGAQIQALLRRQKPDPELVGEKRYLVHFRVDKVLHLIGGEEIGD